jgi:hypothetical protein
MIKETELVTLNGNTTAFGGRIYNANYQVGFNESPSSVRLSIINENGPYNISESDLSVLGSPDIISFGGRELKMFPIEYSVDKSDSGKILSVEYVDSSAVYLDKKFVVLSGTHIASKSNGPKDALVTVGQKYWSDERVGSDGTYVQTLVDSPPNAFDLGNSFYYVSELYERMIDHGIPMHESVANILLNKEGATEYLSNIVGTLRNTLLTWGNLMAFAFYWGEDNKLHLIDLESNINVDMEKLNGVVPFADEESFSLKDTVDRGYSLYYGKPGKAQKSSTIGTSKTSFYFKRGIQNYNSTTELSYPAQNKLEMIKAAAISESFFTAYSLYITAESPSKYNGLFGLQNVQKAVPQNSKSYTNMFNYAVKEEGGRYTEGEYYLIEYEKVDTKYSFAFFDDILSKLLTYETAMRESDRGGFNSWSINFNYDYDNSTNFINPNNGTISSGSDPEHRAYLTVSKEWAFDLSALGEYDEEPFIPIDFANKSESDSEGFDIATKSYGLFKKGLRWQNVTDVRYKKKNAEKLKVDGFNVSGGAYNSITPKLERIFIEKPSYDSNTLSTDMQIDSTDDNQVSLAGKSLETISNILMESYVRAEKTFKKSFSITGISLPQNITPEDGLQSISISNTSDKGTVSTYTVGNTFFKIPSKSIILQKLEREKFAELRNSGPNFTFTARYF